jgi:hypothetical protein
MSSEKKTSFHKMTSCKLEVTKDEETLRVSLFRNRRSSQATFGQKNPSHSFGHNIIYRLSLGE